ADDPPRAVEIAAQQITDFLVVEAFRKRREPDEIREQNGDQPPLRAALLRRSRRRRHDVRRGRTALTAEALAGLVGGPARGARPGKGSSAIGAELPSFSVRPSTRRTLHRCLRVECSY